MKCSSIKNSTSTPIQHNDKKIFVTQHLLREENNNTPLENMPHSLLIKILANTGLSTLQAIRRTSCKLRNIFSSLLPEDFEQLGLPKDFPDKFTSLSEENKIFLEPYKKIVNKLLSSSDYTLNKDVHVALKKSPYLLPLIKEKLPSILYISHDESLLEPPECSKILSVTSQVAGDPYTPFNILNDLSNHKSMLVRSKVAGNPNTPADILEKLSNDRAALIPIELSGNPSTPAHILKNFSTDLDVSVRSKIAGNPSTPADILKNLSTDLDVSVRSKIAGNPSTPAETLTQMSKNANDDLCGALAGNPSTPADILKNLSTDVRMSVLIKIAGNPSTQAETLNQMSENTNDYMYLCMPVAGNPSTPADTLKNLSAHPSMPVRIKVAGNPSTPAETLEKLNSMKDMQTHITHNPFVIKALSFYVIDVLDKKSKIFTRNVSHAHQNSMEVSLSKTPAEIKKNLNEWILSQSESVSIQQYKYVSKKILKNVDEILYDCYSSKTLDISNQYQLETLPSFLFDLKHLKKLKLTGCRKLTCPPELFSQLTNLESLELKDCPGLINDITQLTAMKDKLPETCNIYVDSINFAIAAVKKNDIEALKVLFNLPSIDVNEKNSQIQTIAMFAAKNGHPDVVRFLLDTKAVDWTAIASQGRTPLMLAAENDHVDVLKLLLDTDGIDWKATDSKGRTALMLAAKYGKLKSVQFLVGRGDIDFLNAQDLTGRNAVMFAAENAHVDVLKVLVDTDGIDWKATDSQGRTALMLAAKCGKTESVRFLVGRGDIDFLNAQDLTGQNAVIFAAKYDRPNVLELLAKQPGIALEATGLDGFSAAMIAALKGYVGILNVFVSTGNVSLLDAKGPQGCTPLMFATNGGFVDAVRVLLSALNHQPNFDVNEKNLMGTTAAMIAASESVKLDFRDHYIAPEIPRHNPHADILKDFLKTGNPDVVNTKNSQGCTPLMFAARNGNPFTLRVLLNADGVDLDAKNSDGQTALMIAAKSGNTAAVQAFVEKKGVNLEATDSQGWNAERFANEYGHRSACKVLQAKRACK